MQEAGIATASSGFSRLPVSFLQVGTNSNIGLILTQDRIDMAANNASKVFFTAGLALLAIVLASENGWAQRAQPSQGTRQQRMDCADDARFVCSRFIPDVDRITACMQANKRQLSPQCRRHFR